MRLGEFWKNNFKIIRLDWCGGSDGEGAKADDHVESVHEGEGFEECEGVVEGEGVDDVKGFDDVEGVEASFGLFSVFFKQTFFSKLM